MDINKLAEGRGRARSSSKYADIYYDDETQQQCQESACEANKEDLESENNAQHGNKSKLNSEDSEYEDQYDTSSSSSYSSIDETEASNLSDKKYYTHTNPENARHQWLTGFYDYLSRPAMGDKKKSIRLQHAG